MSESIENGLIQAPPQVDRAPTEKYQVQIPEWEGPYDLLLQVIEEQSLNLFDLNIALLLDHYLRHLEEMELIDLDEAGEFLVVAATLAQIKSKMLLPQEERQEEEEEVDPREALVQYLLEYQKIKQAADQLRERPLLGRDVFTKGSHESFQGFESEGRGELFQLVKGFQRALQRVEVKTPLEMEREEVSVSERFQEIFRRLKEKTEESFEDLISGSGSRVYIISSFLAILELVRMKKIKILQREWNGPVFLVYCAGATEEDVIHSEFDETAEQSAQIQGADREMEIQ